MFYQRIIIILFLGSNIFWSLEINAQQIKVSYEGIAKQVNHENRDTNNILIRIASSVNQILPHINFIVNSDNQWNRFYYEEALLSDANSTSLSKLAISIAMDSEQIFIDYSNKIAFYEPTLTSKIKSVQTDNVTWSITQETKIILGYTCYKATGQIIDVTSEGKLVPPTIAWFCPKLNYRGGPTAYATLPGMILELESKKIKFIAKKVTLETNSHVQAPSYKADAILPYKKWEAYFSAHNPMPARRN